MPSDAIGYNGPRLDAMKQKTPLLCGVQWFLAMVLDVLKQ
jgi:hypothetical protein